MGLTVAQGRRRRGEGPRVVKCVAGAPVAPVYYTGGGDWRARFGLCSAPRLRILTWLYKEGSEHTGPVIEAAPEPGAS